MAENTETEKGDISVDDSIKDSTSDTKNTGDKDAEGTDTKDSGSHLGDIPDGAGCTEIWEYISQKRDKE